MSYSWAPYDAATGCDQHPTGAKALLAYLVRAFPYGWSGGICNCRNINGGSSWSHHAECRAVDFMIPTAAGRYIPAYGDPIHELLGPHGRRLGLDHLILNRTVYSKKSPDGRYYGGRHPHYDHAHIGLHTIAADNLTYATLVSVLGDPGGIAPPTEGDAEMEAYIKGQQENLNAAGFTDYEGKALVVDGKYGARTQSAEAKRDAAAKSGGTGSHKHAFSGETEES